MGGSQSKRDGYQESDYDLGCTPGHCSGRMKEEELHCQRSDTRYQPAVFCFGCFEFLWGKRFFCQSLR